MSAIRPVFSENTYILATGYPHFHDKDIFQDPITEPAGDTEKQRRANTIALQIFKNQLEEFSSEISQRKALTTEQITTLEPSYFSNSMQISILHYYRALKICEIINISKLDYIQHANLLNHSAMLLVEAFKEATNHSPISITFLSFFQFIFPNEEFSSENFSYYIHLIDRATDICIKTQDYKSAAICKALKVNFLKNLNLKNLRENIFEIEALLQLRETIQNQNLHSLYEKACWDFLNFILVHNDTADLNPLLYGNFNVETNSRFSSTYSFPLCSEDETILSLGNTSIFDVLSAIVPMVNAINLGDQLTTSLPRLNQKKALLQKASQFCQKVYEFLLENEDNISSEIAQKYLQLKQEILNKIEIIENQQGNS